MTVDPVQAAAVEYRLAPFGQALYPPLCASCFWCSAAHPDGHPEPGNACPVVFGNGNGRGPVTDEPESGGVSEAGPVFSHGESPDPCRIVISLPDENE